MKRLAQNSNSLFNQPARKQFFFFKINVAPAVGGGKYITSGCSESRALWYAQAAEEMYLPLSPVCADDAPGVTMGMPCRFRKRTVKLPAIQWECKFSSRNVVDVVLYFRAFQRRRVFGKRCRQTMFFERHCAPSKRPSFTLNIDFKFELEDVFCQQETAVLSFSGIFHYSKGFNTPTEDKEL